MRRVIPSLTDPVRPERFAAPDHRKIVRVDENELRVDMKFAPRT
ncbi:Hypothetical protein CAP_6806 [Chondromyces apiculatus DSM 436]|uniref:Uncharacterized protein n=1 Tax=Chondromyces apiculatus DSM 436 TaxID=1192034 RepID=A0A017TEW2_9BACT|nr:Hypothetical protein CAP_6806 [Chondromyces apiculatus DSM 436]